jgi:hypothetical protein
MSQSAVGRSADGQSLGEMSIALFLVKGYRAIQDEYDPQVVLFQRLGWVQETVCKFSPYDLPMAYFFCSMTSLSPTVESVTLTQ